MQELFSSLLTAFLPHLLSALIFVPLLAALIVMLVPHKAAKWVALILSLAPLKYTALALYFFNPVQPGLQFIESHPWLPSLNITYALGMDGLSLPLLALNCLLTPICILASWNMGAAPTSHQSPVTSHQPPRAFLASLLALEGAVNGVFVAQDFILFYLMWEAMLIPMFFIIGLWGGENRVYATIKFFLYTFLGSVLMLVAGLYMYHVSGTFSLPLWAQFDFPLGAQNLLFLAFFAAFAVKIPMFPFHTWLPDAHVQAPTAGSVVLAGILLKMGGYGFLRFNLPMLPDASAYFAPAIFTLSAVAVVYAALVAYAQTDIKKMIAYSSVSHMGLVTLGIFSGTETGLHGAMLVMLNHGIVSAGLFLMVGVIYARLHTRELSHFGGLAHVMPAYAFVSMVLMLAAVALPGTNSFIGEFLSLAGSYPIAPLATIAATTGVIFGALYMLHLYRGMFFNTPSQYVKDHLKTPEPQTSKTRLPDGDLSLREWSYFLPLLLLIPLLGLQPNLAMNLWTQPVQALSQRYLPHLLPPIVIPAPESAVEAPAPAEPSPSFTSPTEAL
jgi:NADH-quinone oxidoreductase subunit M